jgi:hypothetical protein
MGGFLFATGGALRAAPVAAFQPPSASPVATRVPSAEWIGRRNWSSRFVPPRPGRVGSRVDSHGWLSLRNRRCPSGSASRPMGGFRGGYPGFVAARHWLGGGWVGVGWGVSGELPGMTHAPEVLGHRGSVGVCTGRSQWGLCECGQLRRRRVALRPADARSAREPGAGTTPKYMLSAVT